MVRSAPSDLPEIPFTTDSRDQADNGREYELRSTSKCGNPRLSRTANTVSTVTSRNAALGNGATSNKRPPAAEPTAAPRLAAAVCLLSSAPCALPAFLDIQ